MLKSSAGVVAVGFCSIHEKELSRAFIRSWSFLRSEISMASGKESNTSNAISQYNLANGRNEMNFAHQPLGVLDEETARTQKTRVLSMGSYSTLTIKPGSDGLLTVDDEEVLLALMFLAQKQTGFYEETLEFTYDELLEVLQRPHKGQSYDQIKLSIDRLMDVSLTHESAWRNKQASGRISTKFHIIDSLRVHKIGENASKIQTRCTIRWGKEFLASCQTPSIVTPLPVTTNESIA